MSKFADKLSRLHASRIRALEAGDEGEARVFHAEPEPAATAGNRKADVRVTAPAETSATAASGAATAEARAMGSATGDTVARRAVREQLELGQRLGTRATRPGRVTMVREPATVARVPSPSPSLGTPPAGGENAVGERLGDLRRQAEALIAAGGIEAALPLLHEIAALSPTHPFALAQLADYWRSRGNERIAGLYAQRLAAVAPY